MYNSNDTFPELILEGKDLKARASRYKKQRSRVVFGITSCNMTVRPVLRCFVVVLAPSVNIATYLGWSIYYYFA